MFVQICLPFGLVLFWFVFVPAVVGLVVESSTMCTGFFIPLVAVLCDVTLCFALLAVWLLWLLVLILLAIIVCF